MTGDALPADFIPKLKALWAMRDTADFTALGLEVATIGTILVLRRIAPKVPWLIFVIAAASALAAFAFPSIETVGERYGEMPDGLPKPSLPHFNAEMVAELLPSAFTIAFLAGIESLLSAIVADRMIGASHRSNAELLAQGAANMASPLFGGLPATGAIARTATNVNAGGRTPVAGMVHVLAILAHPARRTSRRIARASRACRSADGDRLEHERTSPICRKTPIAEGRTCAAGIDRRPDGSRRSDRRNRGRDDHRTPIATSRWQAGGTALAHADKTGAPQE